MNEPSYDVIVVGAGPAGMMAAGAAGAAGASVLLLEKNPEPGRKLLISGGGRCNFTNAEPDLHRLTACYGDAGKALLSPFSKMGPQQVLDFFSSRDMPFKIEDNNRAFPQSDRSSSVLRVMRTYLQQGGVVLQTRKTVDAVLIEHGAASGVRVGRQRIRASAVVVTTGGLARPDTGSTGDGFRWLERAGHTIIRPEPSLVPIVVREPWVQSLQGLAFPDVRITVLRGEEIAARAGGKVLFTHFGLSGPAILNLATRIAEAADEGGKTNRPVRISLNFFAGVDGGTLERQLQQEFSTYPRRRLKTILEAMLPPRLVRRILELAEADEELTGSGVPRPVRRRIATLMQDFRVTFRELQSEDWAVVSSGGVPTGEVDFRDMQSKRVRGLYLAGDMLHINRPSGGYSLQLCWATGYVAGCSAATAGRQGR